MSSDAIVASNYLLLQTLTLLFSYIYKPNKASTFQEKEIKNLFYLSDEWSTHSLTKAQAQKKTEAS